MRLVAFNLQKGKEFSRMLFQALYNWIKYKSLPPSFLFKNRLFIERNSQRPRITARLGSTFKSSKWSLFSQINVSKKTKNVWFINMIFLVSLLFLLIGISGTYRLLPALFSLLWANVDFFDYYLTFIVWFFFFFFSFISHNVYSFFFFNNFSNSTMSRTTALKKLNPKSTNFTDENSFQTVSIDNLNWAVYSWLTDATLAVRNQKHLHNFFFAKIDECGLFANFNEFSALFKVIYFNKLISVNAGKLRVGARALTHDVAPFYDAAALTPAFSSKLLSPKITLFYSISLQKNYYFKQNARIQQKQSLLFNKNNLIFSLFSETHRDLSRNLVSPSVRPFLLDKFTRTSANLYASNAVWGALFPFFVKNDITAAKAHRWLYKYFLLNRKLAKNSQKFTHLKAALGASALDISVLSRNLWDACYLTNQSNFSNFSQNFIQIFENFNEFSAPFSGLISSPVASKKNSLTSLNYLEHSYFWLAKRSFFFSTANAQTFALSTNLAQSRAITSVTSWNFKSSAFYTQFIEKTLHRTALPTFGAPTLLLNSPHMHESAVNFLKQNYGAFSTPTPALRADLHDTGARLGLFSTQQFRLLSTFSSSELTNGRVVFFSYFHFNDRSPTIAPNKFNLNYRGHNPTSPMRFTLYSNYVEAFARAHPMINSRFDAAIFALVRYRS